MKKILYILPVIFLVGCNISIKDKEGVKCEEAVSLAQNVLNKTLFVNFVNKDISPIEIDKNNIVEWDYKDGRYLCKAKVNAKILKKSKYTLYLLNPYGMYKDKNKLTGWIYYQTFVTTKDMKKLKSNETSSYYVEIEKKSDIHSW